MVTLQAGGATHAAGAPRRRRRRHKQELVGAIMTSTTGSTTTCLGTSGRVSVPDLAALQASGQEKLRESSLLSEEATREELRIKVWRRRHWPRKSHHVELVVGRAMAGNDYMMLRRIGSATKIYHMKDVHGIVQKKTKGKRDGRLQMRARDSKSINYRRLRLDFPSAETCSEAVDAMLEHRHHQAPREISLLIGSWNMGNAMPQEDLSAWLGARADVYAVGVQEASYKLPKELQDTYLRRGRTRTAPDRPALPGPARGGWPPRLAVAAALPWRDGQLRCSPPTAWV